MSFKDYLEGKYKGRTAKRNNEYWELFLNYLEGLSMELEQVNHALILEYVQSLQNAGRKIAHLNGVLVVLEQGFNYLNLANNPVQGLRIKKGTRQAILEPIPLKALERLLKRQPSKTAKEQRNQVLLGLVHYQGLSSGDLNALRLEDVDLDKAILFVPSTNRSQSRELLLEAVQIKQLDNYLQESRPKLLRFSSEQLLLTGGKGTDLRGIIGYLNKELKAQLPSLQSLTHWRSSIIVHWLESTPLLEVQQRVGHRYASSTERYQIHAIKSLQVALKKHHPLED